MISFQPCLMEKEGSSSSPISFLEQQKWYKKYWKNTSTYRLMPIELGNG